jgi:Family of unknown function (DUF5335)
VVRPRSVLEGLEQAQLVLAELPEHGIDLEAVAARLLGEGLAAFVGDLANLLEAMGEKLAALCPSETDRQGAHAVIQDQEEIARPSWRDALELLTKEHEGDDITIEVVNRDFGDLVEAEKVPLGETTLVTLHRRAHA